MHVLTIGPTPPGKPRLLWKTYTALVHYGSDMLFISHITLDELKSIAQLLDQILYALDICYQDLGTTCFKEMTCSIPDANYCTNDDFPSYL